jgi:hypothetical protein
MLLEGGGVCNTVPRATYESRGRGAGLVLREPPHLLRETAANRMWSSDALDPGPLKYLNRAPKLYLNHRPR